MKMRIALPVALAAVFVLGAMPVASAKKYHKHMVAKGTGPGQQAKVGVSKGTATGGPSGGSTKSSSGGGS